MGQSSPKRTNMSCEKAYFAKKRNEMIGHFTMVNGFLENSSEWVVIFREEMQKYTHLPWSKPIFSVIKRWESYHDSSSKVAFIWKCYNSSRKAPRIDQSRTCLWAKSITNLQTFSYEVEIDPDKRILNSFLTEKSDCTLFKLIRKFKLSIVDFYCTTSQDRIELKDEFLSNVRENVEKIDSIVLDFIQIIIKVLPRFFLNLPTNIQDIEGIVRNSIVSDELLGLLVLIRKESFHDLQDQYLKGLESFSELPIECRILSKLENDKDENYVKAMRSLLEITSCRSIGQIHDAIAMLMNHISLGLYDESDPSYVLEEEEIIQAFLLIVGKSSAPDLPLYVNILNTFLDNHTLQVKGIGQGIIKLTYIIYNSREWTSFIGN